MLDGSGSMSAPLSGAVGPSRWAILRDALMHDGSGLVPALQNSVAFGLYVYDGGASSPGISGPQCPHVVVAEPALNNATAMTRLYPTVETGASTPTHFALLDLKKRIAAASVNAAGPTYVVLATDGKPNLCDLHDGIPATPDTEQEAVTTVEQLAAAGTNVFVISLAGNDVELQTHLQAVATAGKTGTQPFTPTSQDDLAKAFTAIFSSTASCDVRIEGRIDPGHECSGRVLLNNVLLACNDANGYRIKEDRQSLELLGTACTDLKTAQFASVHASFPCDAIVLF
jgi:hypothetical protein